MAIRIGHASTSRGNPQLGDQSQNINSDGYDTSGEVLFGKWYLHSANGWDALIRAKDPLVAEKMAVAMEQACNNPYIGYSQPYRATLKTEARKYDYDISKVTVNCGCDCSSLIGICICAAGIDNSLPSTHYMASTYGAMEEHFDVFEDYDHTHTENDLRRGDVLVKKASHTIMIVGDSPLSFPPEIHSVDDIDYDTITVNLSLKGLEGVTTHGWLYYKYNSTTIEPWLSDDQPGSYDGYVRIEVGDQQTINLDRTDTTVKSVALILTQHNNTGTILCSDIYIKDLQPTDTVVQIYDGDSFKDAKPHIYVNGTWTKYSPMIYTNGKWTEIRSNI